MKTDLLDIRHADCMDLMREYPDNHFQLAIVDPPYGIGVKTNMGRRRGCVNDNPPAIWDKSPPSTEYFAELKRVSVNMIVWGANHFISRMPWDSSCWVSWDKGFSNDLSFAAFELAWTSFSGTAKSFKFSSISPGRIHPTQKPVKLYEWLSKTQLRGTGAEDTRHPPWVNEHRYRLPLLRRTRLPVCELMTRITLDAEVCKGQRADPPNGDVLIILAHGIGNKQTYRNTVGKLAGPLYQFGYNSSPFEWGPAKAWNVKRHVEHAGLKLAVNVDQYRAMSPPNARVDVDSALSRRSRGLERDGTRRAVCIRLCSSLPL